MYRRVVSPPGTGEDPVLSNSCLLQFAKTPEAGRVKTRLIPPLTAVEAMELHERLLSHVAREISRVRQVRHQIWSTAGGAVIDMLCKRIGADHRRQQGLHLGERLSFAARCNLEYFDAVILVGSDCPFITVAYIQQAIVHLSAAANDLVIGPAEDGGYVLLGLKKYRARLFDGIAWGTDRVFSQTLERAEELAFTSIILDSLRDIDRPADLEFLGRQSGYQHLL